MGVIALLVNLILILFAGGMISLQEPKAGVVFGLAAVLVVGICAAVSLPNLLAGWGLIKHRPWARPLTIVLSVLNLFAFPFGTALGAYGIWVLFQAGALDFFRQHPSEAAMNQ
jgi:hypothetical protein